MPSIDLDRIRDREFSNPIGVWQRGETSGVTGYDAPGRSIVSDTTSGPATFCNHIGPHTERNALDPRLRYHVNEAQVEDERATTCAASTPGSSTGTFNYYLPNRNYSVAGTANADATQVDRLDYSAGGYFDGGGLVPQGYYFDADADGDVDLADWQLWKECLASGGPALDPASACWAHDFGGDRDVDAWDFAAYLFCTQGEGAAPPEECRRSVGYHHDGNGDGQVDDADLTVFGTCLDQMTPECVRAFDWDVHGVSDGIVDMNDLSGLTACVGDPPPEVCARTGMSFPIPAGGAFAMHGRPVDMLDGGDLILNDHRARWYDAKHGRWLQRDPKGYVDGGNLYEAFRGNPLSNTDPMGEQVGEVIGLMHGRHPSPAIRYAQTFNSMTSVLEDAGGELRREAPALARIAGISVIVVGSYGLGPQVGIPVTVFAAGASGYVSYEERNFQFQAMTGQALSWDQATAAAFFDVSQISSGYLIATGEDILTLDEVGITERSRTAGHLLVAVAAGGLTAQALPGVRIGLAMDRASIGETRLIERFPAITDAGEFNLLNVARRGVNLTPEEATAGLRVEVADTAPVATQYFQRRILGDFLRYGRFRGRLGNIGTRATTLDQITMLEGGGFVPQTEFQIRIPQAGMVRSIFPDIAALDVSAQPVRFIEVVKRHSPVYEAQRRALIRQAFPNATVEFVLSAR